MAIFKTKFTFLSNLQKKVNEISVPQIFCMRNTGMRTVMVHYCEKLMGVVVFTKVQGQVKFVRGPL